MMCSPHKSKINENLIKQMSQKYTCALIYCIEKLIQSYIFVGQNMLAFAFSNWCAPTPFRKQ